MKIEKINDNQIKFILTRDDLKERNIKIEDLIKVSDKTQALFRDIIEQALDECGFTSENTPLMVEAVPSTIDYSIMIIVTKLENEDKTKYSDKFTILQQTKEARRFKRTPISTFDSDSKPNDKNITIYSFKNLDDVIDLSARLNKVFSGTNSLYKYNDKYFLLLQINSESDSIGLKNLEFILNEYGKKHISTVLSKYYLIEHAEPLISDQAIKILSNNLA